MVDYRSETLLPLKEAAASLPGKAGKHVSYETIRRWVAAGIRGHKLETTRIGGRIHTSVEAIQRFIAHLSSADGPVAVESFEARQTQHRAALAALDVEFGIKPEHARG